MVEVDYICHGEGISFMRELLGLSLRNSEFHQPEVCSETREVLGVPFFWGDYHPYIIVGLGLPVWVRFLRAQPFFRPQTYPAYEDRQGNFQRNRADGQKISFAYLLPDRRLTTFLLTRNARASCMTWSRLAANKSTFTFLPARTWFPSGRRMSWPRWGFATSGSGGNPSLLPTQRIRAST